MVSAERQTFKCFGCGEGGDIFAYYMKREGVTFPEAIKDLAQYAGVEIKDFNPPQEFQKQQLLIEINQVASKLYHYLLTEHKIGQKALQYLHDRGIPNSQIKDFHLGYAPDSWHTITDFLVKNKKFKPEDVEQTGLIIQSQKSSFYDRFRGRIMFPLLDARGNIVGFSGRLLPWTDDDKSGKYINTPETILYHKSQLLYPLYQVRDAVRKANKIIVVEGELDALSSIRAGRRYTVAVKGSALTEEQVGLIKRFAGTIILALDADEAGVNAAKRAIIVAQAKDIQIKVIHIPEGKDPDELVKNDPKKWRELVKTAMSVYDFFLKIALKNYNPDTLDGKQAISNEIIPILNQITNKVIQDHFINKLAESIHTHPEVIAKEMQRRLKSNQIGRPQPEKEKSQLDSKNRTQILSEELLALILNYYQDVSLLSIPLEDLPILSGTKIISELIAKKPKDLPKFADQLPSELQSTFDHSYLLEVEQLEPDKVPAKINNLISELAKLNLRDKLSKLRKQLNTSSSQDLRQELNQVIIKLHHYK